MDERFFKLQPHRKISCGKYVLGGGELAALTICESILRLGCKVIKAQNQKDTPENSWRPEYYTRPEEYKGLSVPEELTSGDPKKIRAFYESLKNQTSK
jgi:tRNA (guanine37-N1)-methyltransferase